MAKRRKNQRRDPGSGYIRALPNGRAQAHYPKPGGGYFVKRCDSPEEAQAWLAELADRDEQQYDLVGGQQTVAAWLNRWLDLIATDPDNPLKAKAIADYRFKLGYISDLLGKHVLGDLKPDHVDTALRLIRKNLAQTTSTQIRNLFFRAMEEAFERDYIPRNPVRRPKRQPRRRKAQDTRRRNTYRLSPAEAGKLLHAAESRREYLAWWLMLCLGLRAGEVLGLRRVDLDLGAATISIVQQYTQLNGRPYLETPKSEYSERTLPIPQSLVPLFRNHLTALNRRAALAVKKGTWQEYGLLFPGKSGRPMPVSSLLHMLRHNRNGEVTGIAVDAGLPPVTVHHLRHSAARYYTDLGAPDVIRAAIAGHSPKNVTDHYGTPSIDALRPWVEQVYAQLAGEVARVRKAG